MNVKQVTMTMERPNAPNVHHNVKHVKMLMNVSNVLLEENIHQVANAQQDNMKKIINASIVTINVKYVPTVPNNVSNVMETESMTHSVSVHQDFMMMDIAKIA